jgi:hypothetical protein
VEKGLKIIFLTIPTTSQKLNLSKDIDGILMRNPEAMLSDVAFETLKIYLQVTSSKDWFFPGQKVDSHITTRTEQKIFDDAIKKAKFIMIKILS